MTKPRPPRVLDYDPEFGYLVAGTHDVELAKDLLREYLDRPAWRDYYLCDATEILAELPLAQLTWIRQTFGYADYAWQVQNTQPHARGASPAVEWRRQ
jgi:hypothetical protein